jgi:pyrroline-5-carboxylate reductase
MTSYGVIGIGNLGKALLEKLNTFTTPYFYHPSQERCKELQELGLGISKSLSEIGECDLIFLAVKPGQIKDVKIPLRGKSPIFITVMAGVPLSFLREHLGTPQVARMMLDVSVGVPYLNRQIFMYAPENLQGEITRLLEMMGRFVWLKEERYIDTATAVFGCGPAFITRFVQSYLRVAQEAKMGISEEETKEYVIDLFDATVHLLNILEPQDIISAVACKGGATERGLLQLESVDRSLAACVSVAEKRCHELRDDLEK